MKKSDAFPSKYLKATDLEDEEGNSKPRLSAISYVAKEPLKNRDTGEMEQKSCIYFQNEEKGVVLNSTNWDTIADLYGDESNNWTGKEIVLYSDPNVRTPTGGKTKGIRMRAPKKRQQAAPQAATAPVKQTENPAADMDDDIPF